MGQLGRRLRLRGRRRVPLLRGAQPARAPGQPLPHRREAPRALGASFDGLDAILYVDGEPPDKDLARKLDAFADGGGTLVTPPGWPERGVPEDSCLAPPLPGASDRPRPARRGACRAQGPVPPRRRRAAADEPPPRPRCASSTRGRRSSTTPRAATAVRDPARAAFRQARAAATAHLWFDRPWTKRAGLDRSTARPRAGRAARVRAWRRVHARAAAGLLRARAHRLRRD